MDIEKWLHGLGLQQYGTAFRDNAIDAEILPELSDADLEKLGVLLGHRKRLLKAIAALAAPATVQAPPVSPAPSPSDGAERRQLTVMFCDLVGSTALSARLDPEVMREILRAYQNTVAGEVTRFEGHVAKYMGDGVLAYFGYPMAHEDDAERAVRAGLALIDAVRQLRPRHDVALQVRVGIATGLVVVGDLIGEGAAREEAVVGDSPNLAARLQALAEPNSVVVAPSTCRLVGGLFDHSLLKSRRRELHWRIAAAVEARDPEAASSEPEILAYHYAEAEQHDRAARYRLEAGRSAKARHASLEATAHLETALRLAAQAEAQSGQTLRDVQRDAWLMLGDLTSLANDLDRANACYDRALALTDDEAEHRAVCNRHHRPAHATRNRARIVFYEHGSGAPTIVFVNPIVYGLATFQPILERLCQEFRVITVDCRGAGRSDPIQRPYGIIEHVEDLCAVIEAASAAPIVGVGISRGSNQLLHLAHRHPQLVAKLMIVGTPVGNAFMHRNFMKRRAEAYGREDVDALIRSQAEFVYTEVHAAELRRMFVVHCQGLPRETILSFYDPDPTIDVTPILSEVSVPVLVTHGSADRLIDFQAAEFITARLPDARLYAFEAKGHLPLFTATDEFCEVLRHFVRQGTTTVGNMG